MKWIKNRVPTEEEVEQAGDIGFICCISGRKGFSTADHAVVMNDCFYVNGEWEVDFWIDDLVVHGWMLPPKWDED